MPACLHRCMYMWSCLQSLNPDSSKKCCEILCSAGQAVNSSHLISIRTRRRPWASSLSTHALWPAPMTLGCNILCLKLLLVLSLLVCRRCPDWIKVLSSFWLTVVKGLFVCEGALHALISCSLDLSISSMQPVSRPRSSLPCVRKTGTPCV